MTTITNQKVVAPAGKGRGRSTVVGVLRDGDHRVETVTDGSTLRLEVRRIDGAGGISWDRLQELKAKAGFGDRYAVEIFPPDARVVNETNMRHIWILPGELSFAVLLGIIPPPV